MMRLSGLAVAASLALLTTPVVAQDYEAAMRAFVAENVMTWINSPVLTGAIEAQNTETADLSASDIDALDKAWRAEVGTGSTPTITPVLSNAASDFLREQVDAAGGLITEAFVMDARGLNVAASDVTSDYWQGDEAKFTETFGKGAGAVHVGEVEFDESSQTYQGQISVVVSGPGGEPIGAITVGLDAEGLF